MGLRAVPISERTLLELPDILSSACDNFITEPASPEDAEQGFVNLFTCRSISGELVRVSVQRLRSHPAGQLVVVLHPVVQSWKKARTTDRFAEHIESILKQRSALNLEK